MYHQTIKSRRDGRDTQRAWGGEKCTKVFFVGKPEGKRALGIYKRRWEDNIKMNLREIGMEGVDWIHLDQIGAGDGLL
jgi:hypothetical protein